MKTKNLFLMTIIALFGVVIESSGQVTQPSNAITTGSFLGTSNNFDVIFKKNNTFAGMLNATNTSFGYDSFSFSSSASPYYNSAFGALALKSVTAGSGGYNTAVGFGSLTANTGNFSTAVGCNSLVSNTTGTRNNAFGYRALFSNLTGTNNVGIGADALFYLQSGSFNIAIGDGALAGSTSTPPSTYTNGSNNIAIGREALRFNYNPVSNIAIGDNSFWNSTGNNNIGLGMGSGQSNTTGSFNIAIGTRATATSGLDNILIGYQANPPAGYFNHSLNIGNVIWGLNMRNVDSNDNTFQTIAKRGAIGIGNPNPGNTLDILSNGLGLSGLRLSNLKSTFNPTTTANKFLTVDINGDVIMQNLPAGSTGTVAIANGINTTVMGNGVSPTPYQINAKNIYTDDGTLTANRTITMANKFMIFNTGGNTTTTGGRIYIGNTTAFTTGAAGTNFPVFLDINPANTRDYRLYVEGGILTERAKVALRSTGNWADYVFANDYKLMPLAEIESFVKENKHLPGIQSAEELVKNGLDLGDMQSKQMSKIEELTLYAIEQEKKLEKQSKDIDELKAIVKALLEKK